MVECDDFGGTYECEIERIEEKDGSFFPKVFVEVEIIYNFIVSEYRVGSKVRCFFCYKHDFSLISFIDGKIITYYGVKAIL